VEQRLRKGKRPIANSFDPGAYLDLSRPVKLGTEVNHQARDDQHGSFRQNRRVSIKQEGHPASLQESREHRIINVTLAVSVAVPDKIGRIGKSSRVGSGVISSAGAIVSASTEATKSRTGQFKPRRSSWKLNSSGLDRTRSFGRTPPDSSAIGGLTFQI
jgi:hypothetical protein